MYSTLQIPLQDISLSTNGFADMKLIAKGGFGKVYEAISQKHGHNAIKRLDREQRQRDGESKTEIALLSVYEHENIVSLLGFCDEDSQKILVYKYEIKFLNIELPLPEVNTADRIQNYPDFNMCVLDIWMLDRSGNLIGFDSDPGAACLKLDSFTVTGNGFWTQAFLLLDYTPDFTTDFSAGVVVYSNSAAHIASDGVLGCQSCQCQVGVLKGSTLAQPYIYLCHAVFESGFISTHLMVDCEYE